MSYTPETVDIAARRAARAKARAARREGRGEMLRLQCGDVFIADLGPEFPIDVLEPLQDLDLDLPLLIQQALTMLGQTAGNDNRVDAEAAMEFIVGVLAGNPNLPTQVVAMIKEMTRRLLSDAGYEAFLSIRPTPWDITDLASTLFSWYGVGLGESAPSTTPSPVGKTSNTTSVTTSASTRGGRGGGRAKKAS
ncbi:hypothetical protein ACFFMN_23025 [Planobispora siamensis]|uniref:Uncharacterized protein n=1 Tax=Planobispora siamensis TaxID=936338 RepID=A0A8J3SJ31_9ACTN|nr:hypothetical protein [Planobispora siamensis]GIH95441.1 hypothetical protein Psi01_60710 [Planobispora siamensis]